MNKILAIPFGWLQVEKHTIEGVGEVTDVGGAYILRLRNTGTAPAKVSVNDGVVFELDADEEMYNIPIQVNNLENSEADATVEMLVLK